MGTIPQRMLDPEEHDRKVCFEQKAEGRQAGPVRQGGGIMKPGEGRGKAGSSGHLVHRDCRGPGTAGIVWPAKQQRVHAASQRRRPAAQGEASSPSADRRRGRVASWLVACFASSDDPSSPCFMRSPVLRLGTGGASSLRILTKLVDFSHEMVWK